MKLLILIADPSQNKIVRSIASKCGWNVEGAGGAQGALAALRNGKFDAAVVDADRVSSGMAESSHLIALALDQEEVPSFVHDVVQSLDFSSDLQWRLKVAERTVETRKENASLQAWREILINSSQVAHSINNPLSAILGNLEWMRSSGEPLTPEGKECLSDAFECAERIRDIVKTFSQIESRPIEDPTPTQGREKGVEARLV
ncbi:MAG: hypothetical protein COB53_09195 [Elusimicrobia bacterium]|nr:MAG: hypothetical protein COB53_09195 [Elusimicrobiota bacterium]